MHLSRIAASPSNIFNLEDKEMKLTKKYISVVLVAVMMLSLLPALPGVAVLAAPGDDLSERLKLPTTDPGGSEKLPTGNPNVYLEEVSEVYIGNRNITAGVPTAGRSGSLYGNNQNSFSQTDAAEDINANTADTNIYDAYLAVAGDFTGNGKRSEIIAIGANTKQYDSNLDANDTNDQGVKATRAAGNYGLFMFFVEPKRADVSTGSNIFHLYDGEIGTGFDLGMKSDGSFYDGGHLRFDADVDSDGGASDDFIYNPVLLHNYMQVVTGDFTGDGIDEIAVFIPDNQNPRIDVYQFTTTGTGDQNWWTKANWKRMFSHALPRINVTGMSAYSSNMVSLAVGDLNRDGIDDLAVGVGAANYDGLTKSGGAVLAAESQVTVLLGAKEKALYENKQIDAGYDYTGKKITLAENFGLTIGDPDGSGKDKLIFAGLTDVKGSGVTDKRRYDGTTQMLMWEYNSTTKQFVKTSHTLDKTEIRGEADKNSADSALIQVYPHVRADAVALSPGAGMPDLIYYRGWVYHVTGNSFIRAEESVYHDVSSANAVGKLMKDIYGGAVGGITSGYGGSGEFSAVFEYGLQAANLGIGSGLESLAIMFSGIQGNNDGPVARPAAAMIINPNTGSASKMDSADVTTFYYSSSLQWPDEYRSEGLPIPIPNHNLWQDHRRRSDLLIAFPDVDNDSRNLTYVERRFGYSEPDLLAVIAGAPLWKDLEAFDSADGYIGESGTSWATSKGSGTGVSDSTQISLGAFVSVDIMGAASIEAEYKHTWTEEFEKTTTITETVQYETQRYVDSVVLYSIPMDIYVYKETIPSNGTDPGEREVLIYAPHQPAVTVMSVDEYEELIQDYPDANLPAVRGTMLTHTEGYPNTYPEALPGGVNISDARVYSGHWANVGYGVGSITQEITIENEETSTSSTSNEFSIKVGGGFGGVTAGILGGGAWEKGKSKITTNGTTFAGTVHNMPDEARAYDYGYRWKVMQFWYKNGENKIPVVSYLVDSSASTRRISPPANLKIDVEKSTMNSLTMTWSYGKNASIDGFEIYRQNLVVGEYEAVQGGYVAYDEDKDSYSFTESGLSPGVQYTYWVVATKNSNDSVHSNTASGWTLLTRDLSAVLEPGVVFKFVDESVYVESKITKVNGGGALSYTWDKLNGEDWAVMQGQTRDYLSIPAPTEADSGYYRLRVSQQVGGNAATAVSNTVRVTVEKRSPKVDMEIVEDTSGNITVTATVINNLDRLGSVPGGSVDFEISFRGLGPAQFSVPLMKSSDKGTAVFTFKKADFGSAYNIEGASGEGSYTITPSYSGDSIFASGRGQTQTYLTRNADSTTEYYAVYNDEIYSRVPFEPEFIKVTGTKGSTGSTYETIKNGVDGYTIAFSSMKYVQKATQVLPEFLFTPATATSGTHYTVNGTTITPYALADSGRLRWPYQYIASFSIEKGAEAGTATLAYAVNSVPIQIAANMVEISTTELSSYSNVEGLISQSKFFSVTSPLGAAYVPANMSTYFNAAVRDAAGVSLRSMANANVGRYTLTATAKISSADYQFVVTNGALDIVGEKYSHTAEVSGGNGTVAIGYGTATTGDYLNGSSITFVAHPDRGYEVYKWEVTRVGAVVASLTQIGNNLEFNYGTIAAAATITVYFKEKNTILTYSADPTAGGEITLTSPASVTSGALVVEDTPLDFNAEPNDGYSFIRWRVFFDDRTENLLGEPAGTGGSNLYLYMPDSVLDVRAVFERDRYTVTFSEGLTVSYLTPGGGALSIRSGDHVPGDTEVTVSPTAGMTVTEWTVVPAGATGTLEDNNGVPQKYTYTVTENAEFAATVETFFELTLTDPTYGSISARVHGETTQLFDGVTVERFKAGTVVTLTATPDDTATHSVGYWTEGTLMRDMGMETIEVTMDKSVEISHIFMEVADNPMLTFDDTTMISESFPSSPAAVAAGTTVSFKAIVPEGMVVTRWNYIIDNDTVLAQEGGTTLTFNMPSHDVEVEVETAIATYTVTINNNPLGGTFAVTFDSISGDAENTVAHGEEMIITITPNTNWELTAVEITGADFDVEPSSIAAGGSFEITSITSDITITISYIDNTRYPIHLAQGSYGTISAPTYARAGETVQVTAMPDTGFSLRSYSAETSTGPVVVGSNGAFVMPSAGVTVSAIFVPNPAPSGPSSIIVKDFLVSFDSRGGSVVESQRIKSDGTASEPTAPTKKYYSFTGWFYDSALTRSFDFAKGIIEDITLYAGWHWNNPFTDVNAADWFYGDVEHMHVNDVFSGITPTTFEPESPMTRAMIVTVLYRLEGSPGVEKLTNTYLDVESDMWYTPALLWASENGVVQGYEDGKFYPNSPVTREQLAAIIYRYIRLKDITLKRAVAEYDFVDEARIAGYAKEAVYAMQRAGIINGKTGNLFDPQGVAARAEVAAMLHRFMVNYPQ